MRVPDIATTAGYAAPFMQVTNNHETGATYTHPQSSIELNKNGNYGHLNPNLYNTTVTFTSSADEFVQRALSSALSPTSLDYTSNIQQQRPIVSKIPNPNRNVQQNDFKEYEGAIGTDSNDYYEVDTNCGNTYRSFKEVFNINKTFFEECVKDFENINALENLNAPLSSDVDLDPIQIINSRIKCDHTKTHQTYQNQTSKTNENLSMKFNAASSAEGINVIGHTLDANNKVANPCEKLDFEQNADILNENDCEDHSMTDFCNESTKLSCSNEDIDEYLTSPSSSSISLRTPKKRSYFPRGIINPNYPGFQHLAHTLSEHFISSTPFDSYDSDISDYEMELSADSFDDDVLPENNNNNNNDDMIAKVEQPIAKETDKIEYNETAKNKFGDNNHNTNVSENHIDDLPNNLETTLSLFEPPNEKNFKPITLLTNTLQGDKQQQGEHDYDQSLRPSSYNVHCITPDILQKNYNLSAEFPTKKENRPDLLNGVSPQFARSNKIGATTVTPKKSEYDFNREQKQIISMKCGFVANMESHVPIRPNDITRDEISLGITPVDIIGDFGQEVEREFGLLVSGYRRLVDGYIEVNDECMGSAVDSTDKLADASLSIANDEIDSNKFLLAYNQLKEEEDENIRDDDFQINTTRENSISAIIKSPNSYIEDDSNAVDWFTTSSDQRANTEDTVQNTESVADDSNRSSNADKRIYQKSSYDERQLPPVVIEYKRCQQNVRPSRKSQNSNEKNSKGTPLKATRNHTKPSFTNRFLHTKRSSTNSKLENSSNRKREEAELHQYQQLISDKELILSNSRYAKLSSWAQYLKNSVKERGGKNSNDLISPSALELFDAYKIGTEIDMETFEKHLKMAKEIEKKRRSDREEIRRRLAMGVEENSNDQPATRSGIWKPNVQNRISNGVHFCRAYEPDTDTESHSSDSETCPKLSRSAQRNCRLELLGGSSTSIASDRTAHPYHGRPLSISYTNNNNEEPHTSQHAISQQHQYLEHKQSQKTHQSPVSEEDRECDFFTKQARLQIEARMALAQAKEMAHMQMEIERQSQRTSPITDVIRGSMEKVGVDMSYDKRRVSRQILTDMNIAQLQILVNNLHTHIETLNESLVNHLMQRDDLHIAQDSMLVDIEELTRYIGENEHKLQQNRVSEGQLERKK
ncbi:schwannomin-interacting protein 1 homolog [Teleopsis dalmanni]|uniref:schwannomin-interacting protein 1 homolog n=1 Tax=Teleopsis dalmanni TaxID=139649 RepID=UPI0018CDD3A9|nr:schwannomin-interacting protein 1 homolog [Teleopsis dalmanni]XP_037958465.1 schwannomin-interacting protein 1 homolog [Teleopsis dalmanni]